MGIKDILSDDDSSYISLSKLCGNRKISDIEGYLSGELGETVFAISKIVFEGGNSLWVEGEHDFPYICGPSKILPDDDIWEDLYEQQKGYYE